jgi:hypothetical protein
LKILETKSEKEAIEARSIVDLVRSARQEVSKIKNSQASPASTVRGVNLCVILAI